MKTKNLNTKEKFAVKLQLLWSMENSIVNSLPALIEKATDFGLIKSLSYHFAETLQHRTALEGICKQVEVIPNEIPNEMFEDLLSENNTDIEANKGGLGINTLIIAGAQMIEQFEISEYAPAIEYAEQLGLKAIRKRLLLTVEEEHQAHNKLHFLLKNLSLTNANRTESTVAA